MNQDTLSMTQAKEKTSEIFDLVAQKELEHADLLYKICKGANHVTFMGRVGEGVIAPIKARVRYIRIYRDEFSVDFLHYGQLAKSLGLNYHFFQNETNQWNPIIDDSESSYTATDVLVLEYESPEATLKAIELYSTYSINYLIIHNSFGLDSKIKDLLTGQFEESYSQENKGLHIYNKL